jgi:hypothetical protein
MHWLIYAIYFVGNWWCEPPYKSDSLTCNPFVWYLCVWYFGYMYVVGEGKVLCEAIHQFKLLDCLNLLLFVQYTYKVQRSAIIFLEKERNQPLQWTLITKSLLVWLKFLLCRDSDGLYNFNAFSLRPCLYIISI